MFPGEKLIRKGVYVYRCPECRKLERFDDPYEPCCTGPHPSLDEHPLTVMTLLRVDERKTIVALP